MLFSSGNFHRLSQEHKPLPKEWPQAWTTTFYKEYPRFQTIAFPEVSPSADLFSTIQTRTSVRTYTDKPIELSDLGTLLRYSCGNTQPMINDDGSDGGRSHRATPSGGARFPIEAYLLVIRPSADLAAGMYHYRVREHKLEVLQVRSFDVDELKQLLTYEWAWEASAVIFLTAVFARTQDKYGLRGYRYILLEAGHIIQNICLVSTAIGVNACPLAGTHDELVEKLLEIDGIGESLIYSVALGR